MKTSIEAANSKQTYIFVDFDVQRFCGVGYVSNSNTTLIPNAHAASVYFDTFLFIFSLPFLTKDM